MARAASFALTALRRFWAAASAVALADEPEEAAPELEEVVPEPDVVVAVEPPVVLELDGEGEDFELDEPWLGLGAGGGVEAGVVATVGVGSGLTGAGSGFGVAARLVAGRTSAAIVIASMLRTARDAPLCRFR